LAPVAALISVYNVRARAGQAVSLK